MHLTFALATEDDARALAEVRSAAAAHLTARFGAGHWSAHVGERGVLFGMRQSHVWVARHGDVVAGTFRLSTRKPWAIDPSYFTLSAHPLYLTDMAVHPGLQHMGIGRRCLEEACRQALALAADTIRLDAYDANAGAGPFYAKCGFHEVARVSYKGNPLIYFERMLAREAQ